METLKLRIRALLLWGQQYTRFNVLYVAEGGFWLIFRQGVSAVSGLLLAVAFANLLSKEVLGTYRYVHSIIGVLAITTLIGMSRAVTQAVARGFEGTLKPALKEKIRWGMFGGFGAFLIAGYYQLQGNATLAAGFLVVALFLPFIYAFELYQSLLTGKGKFRTSAIYGAVTQVVCFSTLIMTALLTDDLPALLLAFFVPRMFLRLYLYHRAVGKNLETKQVDAKAISYGRHASAIAVIAGVANYLDQFLIFHFIGAVSLSSYFIAFAPVMQLNAVFSHLSSLALPKFAKRSYVDLQAQLHRRLPQLFFVGIAIAAVYVAAAPLLFSLVFPKYPESVFYSQIFALVIAVRLPNELLGAARQAKLTDTPKPVLHLWNVPPVVLIVSLLLLIRPFGILGVIVSRLIFEVSAVTVGYVVWRSLLKRASI